MKTTIKRCVLALLAVMGVAGAKAVPAYPGLMKMRQPDGTVVEVRLTGDEHYALMTDAEGRPMVRDRQTGFIRLAQTQEIDDRETALQADVRLSSQRRGATAGGPRRVRISDIPTLGHQQSLIILVEFTDRQFTMTDPQDFYHRMLNAEGYTNQYGATGSARDFYLASSNGLYQPDFVVVGPVRLPRSYSYYGANRGYQSGIDYQIPEFIHDAALAADSLVDYSQFDSDQDGMVDNIYFFYAGYGEADSGSQSTIWPHSANYYTDFEETLILDGMYINRYACSQELSGQTSRPVGIGTFVHEYGHVLGLADHYNTQNQQAGGPGLWDTMANGSYLNNQHTPPLFSAFEQAELGWLEYTELVPAEVDSIIRMPSLADEPIGYRVSVTDDEYFIIENRQLQGWDKYLPGHGLLVWHVDMDERTWQLNKVNDDPTHQRLDLIEADRTPEHDGGDAFPGTRDVKQFTFTSWAGDDVFGFATVDEQSPTVRFLFSGSAYVLAAPTDAAVSDVMGRQATLTWQPSRDATTYEVRLKAPPTAPEGASIEMLTIVPPSGGEGGALSLTLTGLEPLTDYTVELTARMADFTSPVVSLQFTTTDLFYVERSVEALPATAVGPGTFTANWTRLAQTDTYFVSLLRRELTGQAALSCDFTGQSAALPEGWTTSSRRYDTRYFGQAAPALRLSSDGDYLRMGVPEGGQITGLSFWYRSAGESNTLTLEALSDGQWQPVGETLILPAAESKTADFIVDRADSLRLVFGKSAQYVAIDDIVCTYLVDEFNPVPAMTMLPAGAQTSYVFSNLAAGTYAYTVSGQGPEGTSLPSEPVVVEVEASPDAISSPKNADSIASGPAYSLSGQRVSPAYRGLVIKAGRKVLQR